jgi:hypothetical protein
MKAIIGRKSIVPLALVWTLIAIATVCQAQSTGGAAPNLDKHARKIHKRLTHYSPGTYVSVVLRDGSDGSGALVALAPSSFTVNDADSNARETHYYSDVSSVSRGKEYIGEGSEPGHHIHIRLWVPVVVGVVAAGAAVTAVEVR